jgi:PAS domain S-box-containing protein
MNDSAIPIHVLLVDDRPENLLSLQAALAGDGYRLVTASSGPEAIAAAREQEFAVVLLDVQMPGMDGLETARLLRSEESGRMTPIIFVTAIDPSHRYAREGYHAGAVDYIFKPLDVEVLRAKVSVFADLFRKNHEIKRQARVIQELSERKYQNLVEGIHHGIVWSMDAEGGCNAYVSSKAESLTGYPPRVWAEQECVWVRHAHPDDREALAKIIRDASSRDMVLRFEHRLVKPDSTVVWFDTDLRSEKHETGHGRVLRGLSVDVTHLKNTEQALREAVVARDEFLSIAAHELKTPITPLNLQIQAFVKQADAGTLHKLEAERMKRMLSNSYQQVSRLSHLIDDLLNVSRISEGRLDLMREKTDLASLVSRVIEGFSDEIEDAGCTVELDTAPGIEGNWDPIRLEQVFINLLINALKYAAKSPIRISVGQKNGSALLSVRDQGIGIDPKDHQRIFQRFERAVSSRNYGGLGLGLYIARQLTQLHRGDIRVESAAGKGATFTVELPLGE